MALDTSNSRNLEQLALKRLTAAANNHYLTGEPSLLMDTVHVPLEQFLPMSSCACGFGSFSSVTNDTVILAGPK